MGEVIKVGTKVEDYTFKTQYDKEIKLSDFKGKKVLLSFHPLAWTGICANQMSVLENNYDKLKELNTVPLGLSIDSIYTKKAWGEHLGIEKLLMPADFWPHGDFAQKMGIFREEDGFSERANIILDEEGKVIFAKVYEISDLPDLNEILDFLKDN
ncbi:redoxin domain-containing protein [Orenia metallireducens]|uniref:redoxin domain-containing protein n=1 Tax=Orenia metallireducens TaxID=1413210 RepID=UPI000AC8E4F5|nr:redoxin domain-containing protein [Orenia metallireducens]